MASKLPLDTVYMSKNRECAEIILANIHHYGSEESLMVRWARVVLDPSGERAGKGPAREPRSAAGGLRASVIDAPGRA